MPSTRPTVDPVLDILEEMGYDFDELEGDGYKRSLKEAIIKSINEKISLNKIKTSYKNAKPIVKIENSLDKKYNFIISISHENDFAIAVVISEKIK